MVLTRALYATQINAPGCRLGRFKVSSTTLDTFDTHNSVLVLLMEARIQALGLSDFHLIFELERNRRHRVSRNIRCIPIINCSTDCLDQQQIFHTVIISLSDE